MSMCRVFTCVVGRVWLVWPVHSLSKTLLAFDLLHFVLQGQICLLLHVALTFAFQCIKKQRHHVVNKGQSSQSDGSPSSHVQMLELDHKKAEHQRIDAFELCCWRKLLRVLWIVRSNQSILNEINPERSLEGLMLKLKFQYFGHLIWRADSLVKTLILGMIEDKRRRRWQRMEMVRWHHQLNGHEFEHTLGDRRGQMSLPCYCPWVTRNQTQLSNWTTTLRPVIVSRHWYLNRSDPPTPFILRNVYAIAETIVFTSCKPSMYVNPEYHLLEGSGKVICKVANSNSIIPFSQKICEY